MEKKPFEIIHIMTAKNYTEEQARNFYAHYKGCIKVSGEQISLYEFIQKNGGVSSEVSGEALKLIK